MSSGLHSAPRELFSHADQQASALASPRLSMLIGRLILSALALVALIPRVLLAKQLDMVTDEGIYIQGGKIYLPLLVHLNIGDPGWLFNHEHPPLVKLLIGCSLAINSALGRPSTELIMARLPSILFGTLLVVALYALGKAPFGRTIALLAALSLAFSPWLAYFSALAYLDMTMTACVTCAYLVLWHAIRQPKLYLLCALLVALGAASKYPAVLTVPGMLLFTAYYFLVLRWRLPRAERPALPWKWWLASILLCPVIFLAIDPAIWPDPLGRLQSSFNFELEHASTGHLTFIAGQHLTHMPHWTILFFLAVKMSAFLTIPAAFFAIFALIQQVRFHCHVGNLTVEEIASQAFLLIWLVATVAMFSLLTIVVGTHYVLPAAPAVALAGVSGLAALLRYRRGQPFSTFQRRSTPDGARPAFNRPKTYVHRSAFVLIILTLATMGPHLFGLLVTPDAEGYSSELFQGENAVSQVAYPGYRDALTWLAAHTKGTAHVGLVALPDTLEIGQEHPSWYYYNQGFNARFQLAEAHPDDSAYPYDYLIWPMHLVQRGYAPPASWRSHIIYTIMGGATTYCFILARSSTTHVEVSRAG